MISGFSLLRACKTAVMQNVNQTDVGQLPVPDRVKNFLQGEGNTDETDTGNINTEDRMETE